MRQEVLGIDIGGVISTFLTDRRMLGPEPDAFLRLPIMPGAVPVIVKLVKRFEGRVHLVSKCKPKTQYATLCWLLVQDFYAKTSVLPAHVHFCLERYGKEVICKSLGVTHFIDDRLEVLGYLKSVPHKVLFRPKESEVLQFVHFLPLVTRVEEWSEVEGSLPSLQ